MFYLVPSFNFTQKKQSFRLLLTWLMQQFSKLRCLHVNSLHFAGNDYLLNQILTFQWKSFFTLCVQGWTGKNQTHAADIHRMTTEQWVFMLVSFVIDRFTTRLPVFVSSASTNRQQAPASLKRIETSFIPSSMVYLFIFPSPVNFWPESPVLSFNEPDT